MGLPCLIVSATSCAGITPVGFDEYLSGYDGTPKSALLMYLKITPRQ